MKPTKKTDIPQALSATEILKSQHRLIEGLFRRIARAKDASAKREIFQEIASNLVAHDGIEREVFYPACEAELGMTDLLGEALVEHGVVEFALFLVEQGLGAPDFDFRCTVLKELVLHHVEEEERKLLPKIDKAMNRERRESLGRELQESHEVKMTEDYRLALYGNLRQVLEGAIKTRPLKEKGRPVRQQRAGGSRKKASTSPPGGGSTNAASGGRRGNSRSPSSGRARSKKSAATAPARRMSSSGGGTSRTPTTSGAGGKGSRKTGKRTRRKASTRS
jgi:hemerythrin superfamily protein